jgi:NUMOD4 motif/HNH endonuclease
MEEWRAVVGWEGLYEVSSEGRVRSLDRQDTRRGSHGRKGRVLKVVLCKGKPYLSVSLSCDGKRSPRYVHQLVADAFRGPRPEGLETRHLDGDHQNNREENLLYGTSKENHADTVRHGRWHPGDILLVRRPPKVTLEQCAEIQGLRGKLRQWEIAERYGISQAQVCVIQRGRRKDGPKPDWEAVKGKWGPGTRGRSV